MKKFMYLFVIFLSVYSMYGQSYYGRGWAFQTMFQNVNLLNLLECQSIVSGQGMQSYVLIDNNKKIWFKGLDFTSYGSNFSNTFQKYTNAINNYSWKQVAMGLNYVLALDTDGKLWGWGENNKKNIINSNSTWLGLTPIQQEKTWKKVFTNSLGTSFGIDINDKLWAWGDNSLKLCGAFTNENYISAREITQLTNCVDVSAGMYHVIALDVKGQMFTWGFNIDGTLGKGFANQQYYTPSLLKSNVRSIAATYNSSAYIDINGDLYTFGENNTSGSLGQSDTYSPNSKVMDNCVSIKSNFVQLAVRKNNGKIYYAGCGAAFTTNNAFANVFTEVEGIENSDVGEFNVFGYNLIIKQNDYSEYNNLYVCGRNNQKQLGDGTNIDKDGLDNLPKIKYKYVSCGYGYTLAIDEKEQLYGWGGNSYMSNGVYSYGLAGQNSVIDQVPTPMPFSNLCKWKKISAGCYHALAIDENGHLWGWGSNQYGQLGIDPAITSGYSRPTLLDESTVYTDVSAGYNFSLVIKSDFSLWATGYNDCGQLGIGTYNYSNQVISNFTQVTTANGLKWKSVSAGFNHTIALSINNEVYAWGSNDHGELGNTNSNNSIEPVLAYNTYPATKVSAGKEFSAIIADGRMLTAGKNDIGQCARWCYALLNGECGDYPYFGEIETIITYYTPNGRVNIENSDFDPTQWANVECGTTHTIAVQKNGDIYTWGNDVHMVNDFNYNEQNELEVANDLYYCLGLKNKIPSHEVLENPSENKTELFIRDNSYFKAYKSGTLNQWLTEDGAISAGLHHTACISEYDIPNIKAYVKTNALNRYDISFFPYNNSYNISVNGVAEKYRSKINIESISLNLTVYSPNTDPVTTTDSWLSLNYGVAYSANHSINSNSNFKLEAIATLAGGRIVRSGPVATSGVILGKSPILASETKSSLSVFPNPAVDRVTIQPNYEGTIESITADLFTMDGQKVTGLNLANSSTGNYTLDLPLMLSSGNYILNININNTSKIQKGLVISR